MTEEWDEIDSIGSGPIYTDIIHVAAGINIVVYTLYSTKILNFDSSDE